VKPRRIDQKTEEVNSRADRKQRDNSRVFIIILVCVFLTLGGCGESGSGTAGPPPKGDAVSAPKPEDATPVVTPAPGD